MLGIHDERSAAAALITASTGLLYISSRLAVGALARPDGSDAFRRALAQWIPIACTAVAAILMKEWEIALAIVFGTSVACLSLVLGMATFVTSLREPPESRRVWPFVVPAALLCLIAGFSGYLTWWHGLMLLAMGAAFAFAYFEVREPAPPTDRPPRSPVLIIVMLAVAAVLAIIGAPLAVWATQVSSRFGTLSNPTLTAATLAGAILCPLLTLSPLGTSSTLAHHGHPGRALTSLVGMVLLNLCLLLPILIAIYYVMNRHNPDGMRPAWEIKHAIPYDLTAWRIETVLLLVLGFVLTPVSLGRLHIGKLESLALVLIYIAYLMSLALNVLGWPNFFEMRH